MNPYTQGQLDFCCAIYAVINSLRLTYGIRLSEARKILAEVLSDISKVDHLWNSFLLNRTDGFWLIEYVLRKYCTHERKLKVFKLDSTCKITPLTLANTDDKDLSNRQVLEQSCLYRSNESRALSSDTYMDISQEIRIEQTGNYASSSPASSKEMSFDDVWGSLNSWLPERKFLDSFDDQKLANKAVIMRFHRYLPYQELPLVSHWTVAANFSRDTLNFFDCTADKTAIHRVQKKECMISHRSLSQQRFIRIEPESLYFMGKESSCLID